MLKLNPPSPLPFRWRPSRSAVWTYLPVIINSASSTTPMEKCVATTPGRSFSWSMKARMLSERGTPQPLAHSSSFSIQSPVHSLTNYPHVCLYCSFDPVHLTVVDKAKVSTDVSSSLNRSERRHMRDHASAINWGHFSDFHAIGYSQLIPIDFHSGGFAVRCRRLRQH